MTVLGQRIRLDPNNVQATFLERCAGTARFAWNWALARWKEQHEAGERPSWRGLNAEMNAVKAAEFPWMSELPWKVTNGALSDLGGAFAHFFRRVKAGAGKPGHPNFKKRGRCREGFAIEGRALVFEGRRVKIPKLGWVRTRQDLRFPGKVLSARFSKRAGHWFVSIQVEVADSWVYPHRCETQAAIVGIDLGLRDLAVLSDGTRIEAPRSLRRHEPQIRRLNKELDRRKRRRGANWRKTRDRLARLYERIADVRHAVTHRLTADVVRRFGVIGVETLSVQGMAQGLRLGKSVMDAAPAEVLRQLAYKAPLAGGIVVQADRWFPSSKTCHVCGVVRDNLPLGIRRWTCDGCGAVHDRDDNASQNLRIMAAAHAATAQRQGGSGGPVCRAVKPPSGWEPGNHAVC